MTRRTALELLLSAAALLCLLCLPHCCQAQQRQRLDPALVLRAMSNLSRCRQATGVSKGEMRRMFETREIPSSQSGKCLMACMAEAYGVMEEGRFRADVAMGWVDQFIGPQDPRRGRIQNIIDTCNAQVGDRGDKCETAASLASCGRQYVPSRSG